MKKRVVHRKAYWIYNETYRTGFYFCPGFTEQQLAHNIKRLVKYDCNESDYTYLACHDGMKWNIKNATDNLEATFLWTKSAKLDHQTLDTLTHEAWHMVSEIFKTHEIKHDVDNDETGAYLIGWMMRKLVRCLEEENK